MDGIGQDLQEELEYHLIPINKREKEFSREERIHAMTPFLLRWYRKQRRILPWRENHIPYYVWISEIMLQQTRVEAVKPYFERFTKTLPEIGALAEVEEEVLLKLWEGLGYYNRARNLKKAAQIVMEQFNGRLPDNYEKLLTLPGIGSYTAGAIASIAYGIPVPAVDGNVLRVFSRLMADNRDILNQSVKKELEMLLKENMPKKEAAAFNQALMEIGAMVCLPNGEPKCMECPLSPFCQAHADKTQLQYPVKKAKKKRRVEERTVLLICRNGTEFVLEKREEKGLLAGLYEFPNFLGPFSEEEIKQYLKGHGLALKKIVPLGFAKHIFSHVEWHMAGYEVEVKEIKDKKTDLLFVELEKLRTEYPIPNAFAAYKKHLGLLEGK